MLSSNSQMRTFSCGKIPDYMDSDTLESTETSSLSSEGNSSDSALLPIEAPNSFVKTNLPNDLSGYNNAATYTSKLHFPGPSGSNCLKDHILERPCQTSDFGEDENKAFTFMQDIVKSSRKMCNYKMCDKVLRFYATYCYASQITVKEFFEASQTLDKLEEKLIKTDQEFDTPSTFEYIFDDMFHNKPIRDVLKSYVTFYVNALYEKDATKDHFVKQALKYMPFRDSTYLCEAFPEKNEKLNVKDLSLFLSIAAVLAMLDECKKRNILTKRNSYETMSEVYDQL